MKQEEVVCSSCKATVPHGKFCCECGFSFVKKMCSSCNLGIIKGNFCSNCGHNNSTQASGDGSGIAVGVPVMMPAYNVPAQKVVKSEPVIKQPQCQMAGC